MKKLRNILTSPDSLERMTPIDRESVATRLLQLLGNGFDRTSQANDTTVRVWDNKHELEFTLVPGGMTTIGLRPDDRTEISKHIEFDRIEYSIEVDSESAQPLQMVNIAPFLCSCKPLALGTVSRKEAIAAITASGFRLPSEVELEWILRDGGRYALTLGAEPVAGKPGVFIFQPSRYGIEGLCIANWAADDWHPSYDGLPANGAPWMNGDSAGVCRSTFALPAMITEEDIAVLLAALRTPGHENMPCVARAVIDLPVE